MIALSGTLETGNFVKQESSRRDFIYPNPPGGDVKRKIRAEDFRRAANLSSGLALGGFRSIVLFGVAGMYFVTSPTLTLYTLVDLFAMDGDFCGGSYSQSHLIAPDVNDDNLYIVTDHDRFVALS